MTEQISRSTNQLVSFYSSAPKRPANSVGVELLPIDRANTFALPGPAVVGIVYVRHPIDQHELIAFADYDERIAQDRYREALRVFTALGAARIVATSRRETVRQARGSISVHSFRGDFGASRRAEWSLAFDQEGSGGRPADPRPLRFADEPMLDAVCDGVLHLGVKKGRIQITRSSTLGVDGELATRLKKAGFKLGVSGTRTVVTDFVIEAAFSREVARDLDKVIEKTTSRTPARRSSRRRSPS